MTDREHEHDPHEPGMEATPPAERGPEEFGADWVDPEDAAEEMEDETEGRS
jgi:hypothetical protein